MTNYKKKNKRKLIEKFAKDNSFENVEISNSKDSEQTREGSATYTVWFFNFDYRGESYKYETSGDIAYCEHHSDVSELLAGIEDELNLPVVIGSDGY